jgi:hypothetical protein
MAEVKVYYDKLGNTLTFWFGEPNEEYICEEIGDEVILMKNKSGVVIGFEKLNYNLNNLDVIFKDDWAAIEETLYLNSIHGYIDSLKEVMISPRSQWGNAQELGL